LGVERTERAALVRESCEEWRRLPPRAELAMELGDALVDRPQPDAVGVEHRPAAPRRKAVAVHVDDVDVRRAQRSSIGKNPRTFIDEGVDRALLDLLVGDLAP